MSLMEQIYKEVIVSRSRRPKRRGAVDPATHVQEGLNPSCGDELTLTLRIDSDTIEAVRHAGQGCAISQASADLMAEAVEGHDLEHAKRLATAFRAMLRGEEPDPNLGELRALQGVAKLHARVKCATLPWTTLEGALAGRSGPIDVEAEEDGASV